MNLPITSIPLYPKSEHMYPQLRQYVHYNDVKIVQLWIRKLHLNNSYYKKYKLKRSKEGRILTNLHISLGLNQSWIDQKPLAYLHGPEREAIHVMDLNIEGILLEQIACFINCWEWLGLILWLKSIHELWIEKLALFILYPIHIDFKPWKLSSFKKDHYIRLSLVCEEL